MTETLEGHSITLNPHPDVKTIHTAHCECGESMRHPGTNGIIREWVRDHHNNAQEIPRSW